MKSSLTGESNCFKTSMKDKPTIKTGSFLAHLLLVVSAFICTQLPLAHAADSVPTVTTDQEDYPPFSVVWITGSGFQPGETVSNQVVQVEGPAPGTAYEPWGVVADTNGNFATSWYVFSDELLNTTLRLTATGQTSGLIAETTFTDASSDANNGSGTMTVSPTSVTAGSTGNSFTFSFRALTTKPGAAARKLHWLSPRAGRHLKPVALPRRALSVRRTPGTVLSLVFLLVVRVPGP